MKRKNVFVAMLIFMLAMGFVLSGCGSDDDSGGEADTWSLVTSANQNQLNGIWRGTYTATGNFIDLLGEYDDQWGNIDGIRVKEDGDWTMTINASAGTMVATGIVTCTLSGGRINAVWESIKNYFQGVTFNDRNHSMTVDGQQSFSVDDFLLGNQPEINQNSTRTRWSMYHMANVGDKRGYFVMNKQ